MSDDDATSSSESPADNTAEQTPQPKGGGRLLIGSQRDPAAYQARRQRDWEPIVEPDGQPETPAEKDATVDKSAPDNGDAPEKALSDPSTREESSAKPIAANEPAAIARQDRQEKAAAKLAAELEEPPKAAPVGRIPPPTVRDQLSPDLEAELNEVLSDTSFEELITAQHDAISKQPMLEAESRHTGRVVAVRGDDLFVELGSREQGVLSSKQLEEVPEVGTELELVVQRFVPEEGLYELIIPDKVASVSDWDDLHEGMLVDARVTGHNAGGLECEVNNIRGFIPISQIAIHRVEDLEEFAEEKFTCLVTEANPGRGNLVLSRRAVLEREQQEAREKLLESLEPGQIHEGVVRKILDFGAFVDIGGLDGLLHVSQLAWHRVNHPNEILSEGQTIKVTINKIDHATGKMSLGYREMLENPWTGADRKYPENSIVKGKVSKIMEFGAFIELEPGVEGLVHISELSYKHIWRPTDVVNEGDEVEVLVLSVDTEAQRMSLSIKQTMEPEPVKKKEDGPGEAEREPPKKKRRQPSKPLKGGLGRSADGESTGLKW